MDNTALEDIMSIIALTKQSVDLNPIKVSTVTTNDVIMDLADPELQKLMVAQDNDINILYILVSKSPKQVELGVEFTHEKTPTIAKVIFPYECEFGDIIRMLM